jgi:hypothetical protein
MSGGAEAGDGHFCAFQLAPALDIGAGHPTLQPFGEGGSDDHNVRALHLRAQRPIAAADRELNFTGEKGADHPGAAAADDDDFGVDAVFFEKSFFFGHPDAAVSGAHRAQADAHLLLRGPRSRQHDKARCGKRAQAHKNTPAHAGSPESVDRKLVRNYAKVRFPVKGLGKKKCISRVPSVER